MWNPLGSGPQNYTGPWTAEPTRRGSFNILSTCLLTLSLCVWTALHLNIPAQKEEGRQSLRKVKWLVIGLLAPEVVAYTACHQWHEAHKLHKQMREFLGQRPPIPMWKKLYRCLCRCLCLEIKYLNQNETSVEDPSSRHEWTIVHSYYTIMGGFAIDIIDNSQEQSPTELSDKFLPIKQTRLTLTPAGIRFIAQKEPKLMALIASLISEKSIEDKSKADHLAKFLVCLQAAWFCLQCISRLAYHLPISILELNTFAHAICTLVIYAVWMNKPLDIRHPTLIPNDQQNRPLFSLMYMSSKIGLSREFNQEIVGNPPWFYILLAHILGFIMRHLVPNFFFPNAGFIELEPIQRRPSTSGPGDKTSATIIDSLESRSPSASTSGIYRANQDPGGRIAYIPTNLSNLNEAPKAESEGDVLETQISKNETKPYAFTVFFEDDSISPRACLNDGKICEWDLRSWTTVPIYSV